MSELGFGPFQIGIVASAALLGTAAVTLAIGFLAPGRDLRNLLLVGAFATVATGIAFPATEQLAFILLIAFVGTMNPSSGDIGLFVPLEHTPLLAREAPDRDRTRIFAHYSLSIASFWLSADHFRSSPLSRHAKRPLACLKDAICRHVR